MTGYRKLPLAAAITLSLVAAGAQAATTQPDSARIKARVAQAQPLTQPTVLGPQGPQALHGARQLTRYVITFDEPALASYRGNNPQYASIPRLPARSGKGDGKLDLQSSAAKEYVDHLQRQQSAFLSGMEQAVGHSLPVVARMQYALNAMVVELSAADAAKVAKMPGISSIRRDRKFPLATDIGPGFIGASNIWFGQQAGQDTIFINGFDGDHHGYRGEGMVIGDLDTGYNSLSPSFSASTESGYTFTNPLGSGNYIGQCDVPMISVGGCNDKVIGVYDLVNKSAPYTVEDYIGHGSHTASTAGGNGRWASIDGYTAHISGVAPHANMVIFRVCDASGCWGSDSALAVEHAIQDGLVDTLNFSISGGEFPWTGAASQAFLNASNAGIFVAAAAGNTNSSVPNAVPGTVNHWEPWVTTVAAGTDTGGTLGNMFDMTGPGSPPASVQDVALRKASGAPTLNTALPGTTPFVLSPAFQNQSTTGTDGCSAYAADTFKDAIALISRGTCSFHTKAVNAENAGAIAIVVSDNQTGAGAITFGINVGGSPAVAVPVWWVTQSTGTDLQTFANGNPGPTASITAPTRLPQQPDVLADFSLLGPGNSGVIKPDVQAPGVNILAAVANDGGPNGPDAVDFYNGTSMATPHTTGAATLLMGLHPDWTPSELKSALMMTSKETGLTKPDGSTPSDPYDRGAGRIRVDVASKAGLVMNETGSRYQTANPANGGDPSTLNLPSMENLRCFSESATECSFVRTFRSTSDQSVNWTASVTGDLVGDVSLAPASNFTTLPGGSSSLQITVDASSLGPNASFGDLVLTPDDGSPVLHLPIAAALPAPVIAVPSQIDIDLDGDASKTAILPVSNTGGPGLNFSQDTSGSPAAYTVADYASQGNNGYFSTFFPDQNFGFYAAQQFTVGGVDNMDLSLIWADGFSVGQPLTAYPGSTPLHVAIYADAGGKPAGNPEDTAGPAPVWEDVTTLGSSDVYGPALGVGIIAVFPPTPTNLAPGKYWMMVYPEIDCAASGGNCTQGWVRFITTDTSAAVGQTAAGTDPWSPISPGVGFATYLLSNQACNPIPWLGLSPGSGTVGAESTFNVTLTATAANISGAAETDYLCLSSNTSDFNSPAVIQVTGQK